MPQKANNMNDHTIKIYKHFLKKADDTARKEGMFSKGDRVLVGVSGGPDSIALLLFLLEIKGQYSLDIGIAHLNHMLRGDEADRDEGFVNKLASSRNITCYIEKKDVAAYAKENKLSIEDSARQVRYSFLQDTLKEHKYTKIALGHNNDDNAELILMNILRGSGPKGLAGIPPVRESIIVRPLIKIPKQEIISFLDSIGQEYMIDSSNNENIYLRNSIRNSLIPLIEKKYNPKIKESLIRLSHIIKDEDDWMEKETELIFDKAIKNSMPRSDCIEFSRDILEKCHPALRKRLLRKAIIMVNGNLKKISLRHINDAVKLFLADTSGESIDLPSQIRVFKEQESLFIKKESIPLRELGEKRKSERY